MGLIIVVFLTQLSMALYFGRWMKSFDAGVFMFCVGLLFVIIGSVRND